MSEQRGDAERDPRRTWSDAELAAAVAAATSLYGVFVHLGLKPGGTQWIRMRQHVDRLGLDTSHWTVRTPTRKRTWSDAELADAVAQNRSIAGVLRQLGLKVASGSYKTVQRRIGELGLDVSHHTGQGWTKGLTNPIPNAGRPLEAILVRDSPVLHTATIKRRLYRAGLKEPRCEICGITDWRGMPLSFHLDHINGIRTDNRLENLRILCPNCHSQTDTWCARNRGAYDAE